LSWGAGVCAAFVLLALLGTDLPQPAAGHVNDAPNPMTAPRSGRAFDPQFANTNPVGGAVVPADSLGMSFALR
jgi:hypothetical protein